MMMIYISLVAGLIFASVSEAFIVNTQERPVNSDGHHPFLGSLQGYDPVSANQQGGSPNFQQPNVLTGQKVQIQSATSKPVFGIFGQQQPTQCQPTAPNMQQPAGASQQLYDYYNHLHATSQPFPHLGNTQRPPQRPQRQPLQQELQYGSSGGIHYGQANPPQNPIQQVTGTSGPLQVFSKPDHVPISMQLTSQQGRPIFISNNNNQQQPQQAGTPLQGAVYGNQNGQQAPSGGPVNQERPPQQVYRPRTTQRPQSGPIGYQPINVGKRSVRARRAAARPSFDPNQVNSPSTNKAPTGYQAGSNHRQTSNNMGAPSYFTDPFKFQMDQEKNPLPHGNNDSREKGVLTFSAPSFFVGRFESSQSSSSGVDAGTQTEGSISLSSKHNSNKLTESSTSSKNEKGMTSDTRGQTTADDVSSSTFNQGGDHGKPDAVNQGGLNNLMSSEPNTHESSRNDESLVHDLPRFDPNKVNQSPFNFFDPTAMMRGKRQSLQRRAAGFDPTKMNAGTFEPSKMTAGSYNPASANGATGAKTQNPALHPAGQFNPSSMSSGSFNPGQGDAGQSNPGSPQQNNNPPLGSQKPPAGQIGAAAGTQTGSNPNPQTTQGQGYDPDKIPAGSAFVPGSNGEFDPSAWADFIG